MTLYHLALAREWRQAVADGAYMTSTLGVSLAQEGFIHTSRAHQVRGVADAFYADVAEPLVLLTIDETLLTAPWRVDPVPGAAEGFPHVYGPINASAVVEVRPLGRGPDGRLLLPDLGEAATGPG